MRFDSAQNTFQFEMKFTGHDIEKALSQRTNQKVILDEEAQYETCLKFIQEYVNARMSFKINSAKSKLNVIGYKIGLDDDLWIFCEAEAPTKCISLSLTHKMLTEQFGLQQNILHYEKENNKTTYVFTKYEHTKNIKL